MQTAALLPTNMGDEFVDERPGPVASSKGVVAFRQLRDSDPMPFGVHRDRRMDEVPAAYLDSLRDANWLHRWPAVEEYIERNAKAIDQELDEADREHRDRY
jgi:hypothetical protein